MSPEEPKIPPTPPVPPKAPPPPVAPPNPPADRKAPVRANREKPPAVDRLTERKSRP